MTPLDAAKEAAERAVIEAALRAASGSVRAAAKALGRGERGLHKAIVRLGLRPWLTEEYERGARQPQTRTGARPKAKPDDTKHARKVGG